VKLIFKVKHASWDMGECYNFNSVQRRLHLKSPLKAKKEVLRNVKSFCGSITRCF